MTYHDEIYREIFHHFSCSMKEKGINPLKMSFEPYKWYITYMIPNPRISRYFSQQGVLSTSDEIKTVLGKIAQLENDLWFEKYRYNNLILQLTTESS